MSTMDDFNRFAFDRAKSKYSRAQFEQMTHDDWVALVEGLTASHRVAELENQVEDLEAELERLEAEVEKLEAEGE